MILQRHFLHGIQSVSYTHLDVYKRQGYFDFAEIQAMRHNPMYMSDYVEHLDNVLKTTGENLLQGAGTISHAQAIEKATAEYRKYQDVYKRQGY